MNKARRDGRWLLAALILAAITAAPLLEPGFLNTRGGGDSPFLLQRLHQLEQALLAGHFPARWMPDANYGFGYPFFNYYAPLSIYVALFFRLLGFGYVHALELAQLAGFLVAAGGAYEVARRWWDSSWAGLTAAVAYTYAPFHLVNVYVRGDSLAEFWAMAFYPLILLAMDRLVERATTGRSWRGAVALLALAYGGLVLSHNISALIFSPFLLLYGLLRLRRPAARPLLLLGAGAVLGLLVTLWFWLPALAESGIAQTEPITSGYFSYDNHFRGGDLVQWTVRFNYGVAGGEAFRMGLVQALLGLAGAMAAVRAWRRRSGDRAGFLFSAVAFLGATLMITPLSRPLWDHLPLLAFTQFPWRFLSIQALGGALLIGGLARLPRPRLTVSLLIGALIFSSLGGLETDELRLADADISGYRLAEYEWFSGNIGTTVSAEYLPQWAVPRPYSSGWLVQGRRDEVNFVVGRGEAALLERQADFQRWRIVAGTNGATIVLPLLQWPGWEATLDGEPTPLAPAAGSGLATLAVPAGEHTLQLRLERTPLRLAAELISGLALLTLVALAAPGVRAWPWRRNRLPLVAGAAALVVVASAAWLWPQTQLAPSTLSWDFAQRGYLHHEPAGIRFANGAVLDAYTFDDAIAGEPWRVTFSWRDLPPDVTVEMALEQPGVTRFPTAPTIAAATGQSAEADLTLTLEIPAHAPRGALLPRLTLRDAAGSDVPALTDSGAPRGTLFLRPVRLSPGPFAANGIQLPDRPGGVAVRAVEVRPTDPDLLKVAVAWEADRPLGANYAVSLRLVDGKGVQLSQLDVQPGYGFLPSTSWEANRPVYDWLTLGLPDLESAPRPLALVARLYDVESGTAVLTRRLGTLTGPADNLLFSPQTPQTALPDNLTEVGVTFGASGDDRITLPGYRLDRQDDTALALTLYWQAALPPARSYRHFVHVIDPDTGDIVAQHDAAPQNDSYPTDQWSAGEVVADPALVNLEGVPAGTYTVATGLYYLEGDTFIRLPAAALDTESEIRNDAVVLFNLEVAPTTDR